MLESQVDLQVRRILGFHAQAECIPWDVEQVPKFQGHIERQRTPVLVRSVDDIDKVVSQSTPGVYWIETTMPAHELKKATKRRMRKEEPPGAPIIEQTGTSFYTVYCGYRERSEGEAQAAPPE